MTAPPIPPWLGKDVETGREARPDWEAEQMKTGKRKIRPKFWIDLNDKMEWGIECDVDSLTFDGHFVAVAATQKRGMDEVLQRIVNVLNTYHPPVTR